MLPGYTDNANSATPKQLNNLPDELLVEILSMVPPEHRYKIRRVSQKWNSILCDLGYHLEPHFIDDFDSLPNYPAHMRIKVNPAITYTTVGRYASHVWLDCRAANDAETALKRSEFATTPPSVWCY